MIRKALVLLFSASLLVLIVLAVWRPFGGGLTVEQRWLPPDAMSVLETKFPEYRLPLEQDRRTNLLRDAIQRNDIDDVNHVLQLGVDPNWPDGNALPPLFLAIRNDQPEIVTALIRHGVEISAAKPGAVDLSRNAWGHTPIYYAARLGHRRIVDLLLRSGVDVDDGKEFWRKTALVAAVESGNVEMFDFLIQRGAACDRDYPVSPDGAAPWPTVLDPDREAVLSPFPQLSNRSVLLEDIARIGGNDELIERVNKLCADRASVSDPDERFRSAIIRGDLETVTTMLSEGHEPAFSDDGWSALHYAANMGHAEICERLIDHGLDVNAMTEGQPFGRPIHLAIASGSVETVDRLRKRGAVLVASGSGVDRLSPLRSATNHGNAAMVQYLIDSGESVDDPMLLPAAIGGVGRPSTSGEKTAGEEVFEILLRSGAPLGADDEAFRPELGLAQYGQLRLLRMLQQQATVQYDDALLRAALDSGDVELCRYVVSRGATLKTDPDKDASLLRRILVTYRDEELTELMFEMGVARKYPGQFNTSTGYSGFDQYGHPLYHAALAGDVDYCRYLMRTFPVEAYSRPLLYDAYEYDSDIEYFNRGNTPLFAAVFNDHVDVLELFLTDGFENESGQSLLDIEAANRVGATVLHEAVNYGAARCVQLLLAFGADPLARRELGESGDGNTALHLAIHDPICAHSSPRGPIEPPRPRIFPMLAASAQVRDAKWVDLANRNGETILHKYALAGNLEVCKSLIGFGADPDAMDKHGATPLHFAIRGNRRWQLNHDDESRNELCRYLAESGTDLNQGADIEPYLRYFHTAATSGLFEFCRYLTSQGIQPDIENSAAELLSSAAASEPELLRELLDMGANVRATDYRQETPLHHAVKARNLKTSRMLIERGADVNAQDEDGLTPLFAAFHRYGVHVGRFLSPDPDATRVEVYEIVRLLLDAGADTSIQSERGKTVIQHFHNLPDEFHALLEGSE